MRARTRAESLRKAIHVLLSLAAALALWQAGPRIGPLILAAAALLAVAIDTLRMRYTAPRRLFLLAFGSMLRPAERFRLTGATALATGFALAGIAFPSGAALAGILFAGLADPAAALLGRRFGRVAFPSGKTAEGALAFAFAAFGIGIVVAGLTPLAAALVAVAVAVLEAWLPRGDNLLLPPCGAAVVWLAILAL